jgi:hypothetical protein
MRRRVAQRQHDMYRGRELPRLVTLVGFMIVLGMIIFRARDPGNWTFFAPSDAHAAAAEKETAAPSPAAPQNAPATAAKPGESSIKKPVKPAPSATPTGPTDLDTGEYGRSFDERQLVVDRALHIGDFEMQLYHRVVKWVTNQSITCLRGRKPRKDVTFDQLMTSPGTHRLELVEVTLDVRRVIKCEDPMPGGVQLYELWGVSEQSGAWLYDALVQDLPEGFPTSGDVMERVRLVGYFFKLQGYEPGGARPNAKPLAAPLIIGRITWITPPKVVSKPMDLKWGIASVGLVVAAGLFWALRGRRVSTVPRVSLAPTDPDAVPIDQWLDQAGTGAVDSGNNSANNDDFPNGHARISGSLAGGNGSLPLEGFDPSVN